MRTSLPPVFADVFSHLRVAVAQELATPPVAALLEELLAQGWRPWDLRHRVGSLPAQSGPEQDAAVIVGLLQRLRDEEPPARRAEAERAERERQRARAAEDAPDVASDEARDRWIASIRRGLKAAPRAAPRRSPERVRPECVLCQGESDFFVRRDVHLCGRCVDLLAAGEVRREQAAGE
jgi:hypothetical protein